MVIVNCNWKKGDWVEFYLLMEVIVSIWYENLVIIECGLLVFVLKMEEKWEKKEFEELWYGLYYYLVIFIELWNYGLVDFNCNKVNEYVCVMIYMEK